MKKYLSIAVLLLLASTKPAAAQTGRIAHFSHGGSAATLDAAADNFGIPPSHFVADSIEILSDTTAREYGQWTGYHKAEKTNLVQFGYSTYNYGKSVRAYITSQQKRAYIAGQQQQRPQVKIIRRDTVTATAKPAAPAPMLKEQKTKRKKSALLPAAPAPPTHPGVALAVAVILTLSGAGWLLGRKPQPAA